jgi:type II secretion system protein N
MKLTFNYNKLKNIFKVIYSFLSGFVSSTNRRKKLFAITGYILLFLLSFFVSLFFTLPFEEIKNRLVYEVSSRGYGLLSVSKLSYKIPLGLEFADLSFSRFQADRKIEYLKSERLIIRQSILPLLLGRLNLKFNGHFYNGKATGYYVDKNKNKHISINFEGIDISEYLPLKTLLKTGVYGIVNGKLIIDGPVGNLRESQGALELRIDNFKTDESENFIKIPAINIQSISGTLVLEGGKVKSDGITFHGDIDGTITGEIILRYPIATSLLNLTMNIKFSDAFYEKIKNVVDPLNLKKDSSGYYILNVGGAVVFPRLR